MSTITEYGYVARTAGTAGIVSLIPDKAFVVAEGSIYQEVFCIEPARAKNYLVIPDGVYFRGRPKSVVRQILFSESQWQKIVASFGGHEPEIELLDTESDHTPENLRIKLRVLFDKNGERIQLPKNPPSAPQSKRDTMITRLVEHERNNVMAGIQEYENRLRQLSDEKLAWEYQIEFYES